MATKEDKAAKDVITRAKKGEYVKRTRAGDQVAGGIMATIRDEAEKGISWAKEAHFWNLDFAKNHPISMFGAFRPAARQLKAVVNRPKPIAATHAVAKPSIPKPGTPRPNIPKPSPPGQARPGVPIAPGQTKPGAPAPPGAPISPTSPTSPSAATQQSSTPSGGGGDSGGGSSGGGSSGGGSSGGGGDSGGQPIIFDSGISDDSGITSDDSGITSDDSPDIAGETDPNTEMLYLLSKLDELGGNEALIVGAVIMANGPPLNDERIREICRCLDPRIASRLCEGILQCFGFTDDEIKKAGQCIGQARRLQIVRLPDAPIKVFNSKVAKELGEF